MTLAYGIRSVRADMTSYEGFTWPKRGWVKPEKWDPSPVCGDGLHGLRIGDNNPVTWYDGLIIVFRYYVEETVTGGNLIGKAKWPRVKVVHVAKDMAAACAWLQARDVHGPWYLGVATAGDYGTANAGDGGTANAGGGGTANAGDGGTANAGDYGTANAGGGGTANAGYGGTANAGDGGTASAGYGGILNIKWWDGKRFRIATAYVGEDGIKSNTPYKLNAKGKFVEARPSAGTATGPDDEGNRSGER